LLDAHQNEIGERASLSDIYIDDKSLNFNYNFCNSLLNLKSNNLITPDDHDVLMKIFNY
jgi:hypothetical protein